MSDNKPTPMSEEDVKGQVLQWIDDSLNYHSSDLTDQRAKALDYYLGQPFGNEKEGRSQVVSRDIQETVDWIMPSLMKVFTGETVVQYEPQGEDDVEQAEQETEYVNYLYNRKNKGFLITHDWFQDALLMKTGVVKVYVDEKDNATFDYFYGLDDDMVLEILSDPAVELVARTDRDDGFVDIKIKTTKTTRDIKVTAIPPEEFLIDRNARCLEDARFVAHRKEMTVSELREMGVDEEIINDLCYGEFDILDASPLKAARDIFDGNADSGYQNSMEVGANRKVWVSECYVTLDEDGDGINELRRIVVSGNHVISDEEYPMRPFAVLSAHRIAHKFHGMSIYDKIKDIQEIRSVLMRNIMDNIYRVNNGRYQVVDGQVNLDDLINNDAGNIVRVKSAGSLDALPTPALGPDVYNMLDRLEADRGKRTGVTDRSRGLDGNTLHSNQAATSVNQLMTAAEQQIDLIARMFAETGVKDLFQMLHDFAIQYQDQEEVFQLRGKFVRVNPASWRERKDLVVTVGIGNMNKDQQLIHLTRMWEMAQAVVGAGGMGILVDERNIYNILKEMTENAGYKDVGRYWKDPDSPEAQQAMQQKAEADAKPKPDDIKAQAQMHSAQADGQAKQAQAQLEMAKIEIQQREMALREREMSLKEAELELDKQRFVWERAKNEAEYHLESQQARAVAIGDGEVPQAVKRTRKKPSND